MRKLPLSFVIFLSPILLNAQKDSSYRNWAISFAPSIIPMPGSWQFGIQPGASYYFNRHISLLTEITFQTGKKNSSDPYFADKKYLRIKPEIRYFFSTTKEFADYIGLQISYSMRNFTAKYGYYYDHLPGDSVVYYDEAKINSPIVTTSIQWGGMVSIGKSFMLDFFVGIGIRFINTEYTQVINPHIDQKFDHVGGWRVSGPIPSYDYPGLQKRFHGNFGLRVHYVF